MNYYISDLHFGHKNIIRLDKRPFKTVEEMNEKLISNWNNVVEQNDVVYVLGDFCWGTALDWIHYLKQLTGHKVLIQGNHDLKEYPANVKRMFDDIKPYKKIKDGDWHVIMCHYPIPFHEKAYDSNYYMLYGHVHKTREFDFIEKLRKEVKDSRWDNGHAHGNFINVGCMMEWIDYKPRTLEQIIKGELVQRWCDVEW